MQTCPKCGERTAVANEALRRWECRSCGKVSSIEQVEDQYSLAYALRKERNQKIGKWVAVGIAVTVILLVVWALFRD